jgi:5,10-methylenetetrahydromethanopterin reductase
MAIKISVGLFQSGPLPELVRLARVAESLGFDGLWVNDAQCRWRDIYVSLGAIGASTTRLALGPSVTNPVSRHITVTASAMYSLHELTGGRARMGFGIGDAAVKDIGKKAVRLRELAQAAEMIRELWRGNEITLGERRTSLSYVDVSGPTIPVYFAASGPNLIRLAGGLADGALLNVGAEPRYIQAALSKLEDGARSAGRTRDGIKVAVRIPSCVSDEPDATRYVRSRVGVTLLYRAPADLDEAERQAVEKIRRAHDPREHLGLDASYAQHVTNSLIDKFALAGPPEKCLERVRALVKTGVDELNLTFMHPDTETLLRVFARRIMETL